MTGRAGKPTQPQHADAELHRLARLPIGAYFALSNGHIARRG
jgi:hypothetical protein